MMDDTILKNLAQFRTKLMETLYEEGVWDCALIIGWWADLVEGADYYKNTRGCYSSKLSGLHWIESHQPGARCVAAVVPYFLSDNWVAIDIESVELLPGDIMELRSGNVAVVAGNDEAWTTVQGLSGYGVINVCHAVGGWSYQPDRGGVV